MKKITFLCLTFILLFVISFTVAETDIMAAQSPELENYSCNINGTGNKAKLIVFIKGTNNTKKVTATINLYQKEGGSYKKIKTWSNLSKNNNQLNISKTCSVTKGKTYKIIIEGSLLADKKKTKFRRSKIIKK